MSDYPHAMYRPGTTVLCVWGEYDVDLCDAESADHEAELRADGWTRRPDGSDAEPAAGDADPPVDAPRRGRPPKAISE